MKTFLKIHTAWTFENVPEMHCAPQMSWQLEVDNASGTLLTVQVVHCLPVAGQEKELKLMQNSRTKNCNSFL